MMTLTIDIEMLFFFLAGFGFHFVLNCLLWAGRLVREEYLFWRESAAHLRTIGDTMNTITPKNEGDDSRGRLWGFLNETASQAFDVLGNRYVIKMLMKLMTPSSSEPHPAPLFVPVRSRDETPTPSPSAGPAQRADFYANYDHTVHRAPPVPDSTAKRHRSRKARPQRTRQAPMGPVAPDPNITPNGSHPDVTSLGTGGDQ